MNYSDYMENVKITITIPKEVKDKLERISKKEMRSMGNMLAYLVNQYQE